MIAKLITPPITEPISLEEAKEYLKVETEDEDILLLSLIKAARKFIEKYTKRAFIRQVWQVNVNKINIGDNMYLPNPPTIKLLSVKKDGEEIDLDNFMILRQNLLYSKISLRSENPDGIEIVYEAGYGENKEYVPEDIRQAIKIMVANFYEKREGSGLTEDIKRLTFSYRVIDI